MIYRIARRYTSAYTGLPKEVWILAFVFFVNRCGTMVLPFLVLYCTEHLHMTAVAAGLLITCHGIGAIIGAYLGGLLCEPFGTVRLQTVSLLFSAPFFLILGQCQSWGTLASTLLCLSVLSNMVRPANATAIAKLTTGEMRPRAFGLQRLAFNLGFSVGPSIGGILVFIDYKWLFIADAFSTLCAGCIMLYAFRMRRISAEAEIQSKDIPTVSPMKDKPFLAYVILLTIAMTVFHQLLSTYPLYLKGQFGLTERGIALLFAVNALVIVVFEMLLVSMVKNKQLLRVVGWGSLLVCLGYGILPFGTSLAFAIFAMVIMTVGEMLVAPLSVAHVANCSPKGSEGRYMGFFTMSMSISYVLGPALGTYVYSIHPLALWMSCLGIGVLMLVGFYRLSNWSPRDQEVVTVRIESTDCQEAA